MTLTAQAQRLLERIRRMKAPVVVADLIEGHGYEQVNHVTNTIQELRTAGILFIRSIPYKGRFETELYFEGQEASPHVKAQIDRKPKVILRKR